MIATLAAIPLLVIFSKPPRSAATDSMHAAME
jgi:MFS transporter, DHA2 family, multidrug resistance protein